MLCNSEPSSWERTFFIWESKQGNEDEEQKGVFPLVILIWLPHLQKKMETLLLWSKSSYKGKMIEYSREEFQSSESFGLIYKDAPSRKMDKKDPSRQFHSHPHMASTTICMNTKDPLIGVSMPDLSADFLCTFPAVYWEFSTQISYRLLKVKSPKRNSSSPLPTCFCFIPSSQGQLHGWMAHA